MKIGIITQPLKTNYGGLLQAYALQTVLNKLGYDAYIIRRNTRPTIAVQLRSKIRRIIKIILRRDYSPSPKETKIIRSECEDFIKKNIKTTKTIHNNAEINKICRKHRFNAYIVGSDQVWRPIYSPNIYNDFLDFCQTEKNIKRIAYAASFGVSDWEFNKEQTRICTNLIKQFDAISVREDSGVNLCREYFGVNAEHMLDPTMLLEKEEYEQLAENADEKPFKDSLFCYILDDNDEKEFIKKEIENKLHYTAYNVKAKKNGVLNKKSNIIEHIIPSPTKWIRAFMDAKMVLTDSFHGCVFSIIFNKPFWIIENKERGNARFDSLLKLFNLENRKIDINNLKMTDLATPIDWQQVNKTRKEWQERAVTFLKNNIS